MNRILAAVALTAASMSLVACATVTRGTTTAWEVKTEPPLAKVKTSNGFQCEATPCKLKMQRKSEFTATITKPGYKPVEVKVTHHVAGGGGVGLAGNVLVGGLIGVGIDATSGAMLDLSPNPYSVTLEKLAAPEPAPAGGLADEPARTPPVVAVN